MLKHYYSKSQERNKEFFRKRKRFPAYKNNFQVKIDLKRMRLKLIKFAEACELDESMQYKKDFDLSDDDEDKSF